MDLPEKNKKNVMYHFNLPKPYHKRPEFVNLIIDRGNVKVEGKVNIPYSMSDPNHFDLD